MSLISSRVGMTNRCTIQRDMNTGAGADGWEGTPDWQNTLTDLPCRVWTTSGREVLDANTIVVTEVVRLMIPLGSDVKESDRVSDVTARGTVVIEGPTSIRAVLHHPDRLELVLARIA